MGFVDGNFIEKEGMLDVLYVQRCVHNNTGFM
jgi:hypothetical protein